MPVQYKMVPYSQLLCHQGAYDIINYAGAEKIPNWDMDEFERIVLGMGSTGFFCNTAECNMVFEELSSLDKSMPFLKFGEKGQHYAYELFLSPPENWGSRGAPFFWAYTARQFTYDKLPMEEDVFINKYKSIVERFNIPYGKDEYVYVEQFAGGGMSSGMVGGHFVEEALQTLCNRLKKYR